MAFEQGANETQVHNTTPRVKRPRHGLCTARREPCQRGLSGTWGSPKWQWNDTRITLIGTYRPLGVLCMTSRKNRREFLQTSAAVSAAVATPYFFGPANVIADDAKAKSPNDRPLLGCIGTGDRWNAVGP